MDCTVYSQYQRIDCGVCPLFANEISAHSWKYPEKNGIASTGNRRDLIIRGDLPVHLSEWVRLLPPAFSAACNFKKRMVPHYYSGTRPVFLYLPVVLCPIPVANTTLAHQRRCKDWFLHGPAQ